MLSLLLFCVIDHTCPIPKTLSIVAICVSTEPRIGPGRRRHSASVHWAPGFRNTCRGQEPLCQSLWLALDACGELVLPGKVGGVRAGLQSGHAESKSWMSPKHSGIDLHGCPCWLSLWSTGKMWSLKTNPELWRDPKGHWTKGEIKGSQTQELTAHGSSAQPRGPKDESEVPLPGADQAERRQTPGKSHLTPRASYVGRSCAQCHPRPL